MELLKKTRTAQAEARLRAGEIWESWQTEKQRKTALVFTNELGLPYRPKKVYQHHKKIAAKIGADECTLHDLRHTYATLALQGGDDIKTVQNNLGHATAAFTLDVYGHVSDRMKEESAQRMEQYIATINQ